MGETNAFPAPDLTGQVALVTGGGRGLGRAFAQALAAAGAAVAITARSQDELQETVRLIESARGHVLALPGDVTDAGAVTQMVRVTTENLGAIDFLINNAGVINPLGPTWEADPDEWWHTLDINLRGPFLYARAVLPGMIERRHGRIINITSPGGWQAVPYASAYVISKAALSYLTACLAGETQSHGVAVFSYAPEFVRSAMTQYLAESAELQRWYGDLFRNRLESGNDTPIERTVRGLLWLVSGAGDAFSGRNIGDWDDLTDLTQRADAIRDSDLYTLGRLT